MSLNNLTRTRCSYCHKNLLGQQNIKHCCGKDFCVICLPSHKRVAHK